MTLYKTAECIEDTGFASLEEYNEYHDTSFTEEYEVIDLVNEWNYHDLLMELIKTNKIIGVADIGLWNGRRMGYRVYDSLAEVFTSECDYVHWYVRRNNLRFTGAHHDGTNHVLFREFRDWVTSEQIELVCDYIYQGKLTINILNYYTRSLGYAFD